MTKIEILDYVVDYYKTHLRGVKAGGNDSACTYLNRQVGARCGHSICIEDSRVEEVRAFADNVDDGTARSVIKQFGDEIHKPEFRGHGPEFWRSVQRFHDDALNWEIDVTGNQLSERGLADLNCIKELYKNN